MVAACWSPEPGRIKLAEIGVAWNTSGEPTVSNGGRLLARPHRSSGSQRCGDFGRDFWVRRPCLRFAPIRRDFSLATAGVLLSTFWGPAGRLVRCSRCQIAMPSRPK